MSSKLVGVYWSVMHRRPQDYDYFKRLQPAVFKIMDGGPNDYAWARQNLPNSLIIARDWALSEQHSDMLRDPVGTGQRHAREWDGHANRLGFDRSKTLILGINEPRVWEAGVAEALRQYTIALCDGAARLGLRVGAMQLSVGWPNNMGQDTPPNWNPWHGVEDAIRRGNHVLVLHEYWADNGPSENWGWWAGRALKCPWQVPIVIGECGVDMYVKSATFDGNRGWQGRMPPTRYANELVEYVGRMSEDSRFVGCCVFASDFASHEWWSFDVEPAYEAILATPIPQPEPKPQPTPQPVAAGIIDPLVAQTLIRVESGGQPFGADGRVLIRFEAHIFLQRSKNPAARDLFRHGTPVWEGHAFRRSPNDAWIDLSGNRTQALNYEALALAAQLDRNAAYESISVGLGQIMGFNAKRVGYPSAEAMFQAFADEKQQLIGLLNFFLSDPALMQAVRNRDWRTIAALYNGPGNVDKVAPLLESTYKQLGGL